MRRFVDFVLARYGGLGGWLVLKGEGDCRRASGGRWMISMRSRDGVDIIEYIIDMYSTKSS